MLASEYFLETFGLPDIWPKGEEETTEDDCFRFDPSAEEDDNEALSSDEADPTLEVPEYEGATCANGKGESGLLCISSKLVDSRGPWNRSVVVTRLASSASLGEAPDPTRRSGAVASGLPDFLIADKA